MRVRLIKSAKYIIIVSIFVSVFFIFGINANALTKCDLNHLIEMFPDGKYWNHVGSYENNPDGWTDTPCPHVLVDSGLGYDYYVGLGECNEFGGDVQCVGFVNRLIYEAYGVENYLSWEQEYSLDNVKPGDVIRFLYDMHTVLVTSVDGDLITYGECNGNLSDCQIKWNVQKTKDEIYESFTTLYSAPEPLSVPLANHSTISAESIYIKNSVDIKAIGEGGSEKYTYQISVLTSQNGQWNVLKEYSSDTDCTYTPDKVGEYQIRVRVKDSQTGTIVTRRLVLNVEELPPVPYDELIVFLKMPIFLFSAFVLSFKAVFNIIL